ncbi:MAG: alpha/beta hydrolase [Pseudomonadota bacterium]
MINRFVFALLLSACAPSFAGETVQPPNRFAVTLVAAERFEFGATLVERYGQRGRPLILIPGLASGPWAWQEAARTLMQDHTVYVLTLPGFDGRPAVKDKAMAAAQDSLRELIETRKLRKPVLIGHSLGGTMSLSMAAQHPDLVGGVVSLDGLPLMPGTEDWPVAERVKMAGSLAARMPAGTQASFAAQQQQYMRVMGVTDMARADELAKLSGKSDPVAVSKYMVDGLSIDLRSALPAIKVPVLVMSPFFDVDAAQMQMTQEAKTEYYRALMKGTPNVKVVSISPARHFAMIDQPEMVNDAIVEYLKGLPK